MGMNPSTLKALAYIVQTVNRNDGRVSINQLLSRRQEIRKTDIDKARTLLVGLKILQTQKEGQDHALVGLKEGKVTDFLTIWMRKRANVSSVGHRSVRVAAQIMTLHDGVTCRSCGSIIWKEKVPMPKYHLPPVRVLDLLRGKNAVQVQQFKVDKSKPTHMQFSIDFHPPLEAGKVVEYSFYVWNRNYYSRSKKEALEIYKDEWIREGLGVSGPALKLSIAVRLPAAYKYQDCRLEKGTAPSASGPASPGEVLPGLQRDDRALSVSLQDPTPGNYYICWIPPERATNSS